MRPPLGLQAYAPGLCLLQESKSDAREASRWCCSRSQLSTKEQLDKELKELQELLDQKMKDRKKMDIEDPPDRAGANARDV